MIKFIPTLIDKVIFGINCRAAHYSCFILLSSSGVDFFALDKIFFSRWIRFITSLLLIVSNSVYLRNGASFNFSALSTILLISN